MDSPTPHKTAEPTEYPTPTDTPIESQHLYDINPGYEKIELEANENLFGINIEGAIPKEGLHDGYVPIFNDDENLIFMRTTSRNFDLYSELQPEQARALEDQYGYPESVVMEQADTDGDGALDKVAVRYVGRDGENTAIMDIDEGWDNIVHYIKKGMYFNLI